MKNNNLKTLILSSAILTGAMIEGNTIVAEACGNDFDPSEVINNGQAVQDINAKSTAVINGIKINKQLIDMNYSKGVTIQPKYIVIHDTDNRRKGANAMANRNYFANHPNANASAHYIIDDSNIVQALEDTWKGWHVGDGGNNATINNGNTIGIELAVNSDNNFDKTYETGIELTKYLMRKYNIPAQNIVMHKHASGKDCSRMMIMDKPNMWEVFKQKVSVGMPGEEFINDGKIPTAKGKIVNVSSYLQVRSKASGTSSSIGVAYPNKVLNIYGEENGYYKVDFMGTKKTYGYVDKKYVQKISGDIDSGNSGNNGGSTEADKIQINKDGIVYNLGNTSVLNVRSGAGTAYGVQDTLKIDSKIRVNYETSGWYNISYGNGKIGFVSKTYIKLVEGGQVNPPVNPPTENENTTINKDGQITNVNVGSVLNVRTGAGTSYAIADKLAYNAKVKVNYKTKNNWYNISYGSGKTGFVSADYVKLVSTDNPNTGGSESGNGGTISPDGNINKDGKVTGVTSYLNVRTGPSTSYSISGKISAGTKVKVNSEKNGWYNISYDGKVGYVSKSYITLIEGGQTGGTVPDVKPDTSKTGSVVGITTSLNVRSGAGTSYSVVGSLKPNEKVNVLSESSGWYKISYGSGKTGYVSKTYIKVDSGNASVQGQKGKVINVDSNLNVRSGRGTSYSIIGYLLGGQEVTVLDHSAGWHKISFKTSNGEKTGYVKDDFIKIL